MSNYHSLDLRKRVVDYVLSGHQITTASRLFKVGRKTIYRWLHLLKETGSLNPQTPSGRRGYKLQHEDIVHYFSQQTDATLKEVADIFSAHPSAIWYVCKKMKVTRKKRAHITKNGMKKSVKHS